jgi:tRNA-intron endonuclease
MVPDIEESSNLFSHFYGKPIATEKPRPGEVKTPLILDPIETIYLAEKGIIRVEDKKGHVLSKEKLLEWAVARTPRFYELYSVYRSIRDRGLVVRPGLKFGSDYTVYRHGPGIDHSPYIVNVKPDNYMMDPVEIVKAGRLSHSVRKTFVLATVSEGGDVFYLMFKWFKP